MADVTVRVFLEPESAGYGCKVTFAGPFKTDPIFPSRTVAVGHVVYALNVLGYLPHRIEVVDAEGGETASC